MLEAGFGRVGEFHYLHHDVDGRPYARLAEMAERIAAAASEAGVGLTLLPVLYNRSGFGGAPAGEGQRRFVNDIERFARLLEESRAALAGLTGAVVGIAPHSLRAVTPDELSAALVLAPGGPVHIHIAEQVKEVEDCVAWSGRRPVAYLLDHVPVDGLGEAERCHEVQREGGADVLGRLVLGSHSSGDAAGGVDQHGRGPEALGHRRHEGVERVVVDQVARKRHPGDVVSDRRQPVDPPGDGGDGRTRAGQCAGDSFPEPGGRAGDEGDAAVESEGGERVGGGSVRGRGCHTASVLSAVTGGGGGVPRPGGPSPRRG